MKRPAIVFAVSSLVIALISLGAIVRIQHAAASSSCSPTGLGTTTAALINPVATVSGDVDATGCTFGVYIGPGIHGTVDGASIHDASGSGVFNNAGQVDVRNTSIQRVAVGITFQTGASGEIASNRISRYTRSGIVLRRAGTAANIHDNVIIGAGPSAKIQYGIQINSGATGSIVGNEISDNSSTSADSAGGGLLLTGGPFFHGAPYTSEVHIVGNSFANNDVGVWMNNLGGTADNPTAPTEQTNDNVTHNTITNDRVTPPNQYDGLGSGCPGYQTGIEDIGNNDKLISNTIGGVGYPGVLNACVSAINTDSTLFKTKIQANRLNPDA